MLEAPHIHLRELAERSPFLDLSETVYVVLVSRDAEDEIGEPDVDTGAEQLGRELQEAWDHGVAGDFQVAGRWPPGCAVFEHIDPNPPKPAFTVIGTYADGQRYAEVFHARTASAAERLAKEATQDLTVAGVVPGRVELADVKEGRT